MKKTTIKNLILNPRILLSTFLHKSAFLFSNDKLYLQLVYRARFGKKLNLFNPETYNEKLQGLKLYNRRPEYTTMVDKFAVKDYVANIIGDEYIIPTLGVWDRVEDIDFNSLPQQFVLKVTHDSGGLVICKDKSKLDIEKAKQKLSKALLKDYYIPSREWPYKDVPHKIIAEKYMEDETGELRDFKFFCFDGKVKAMFIATDRSNPNEETKFDFYDMDFNHLDLRMSDPNSKNPPKDKPIMFEKMKELARKISK